MLSKQFWNSLLMFVWSASPVIALPQPTTPATGVVQQPDGPWDYIVVGSGPGGGPLAARLAIAGSKVLLIEAGSDQGDNDRVRVPSLWPLSSQYTPMQWDYFVNHFQDPARAQLDPKFSWKMPNGSYHVGPNPPEGSEPLGILYPRAGTLGGCAAHNALITVYPHDSDWTDTVTLTGDKSWSPGSMRKYYEKLERNEYLRGHTDGHGQDGWLGTNVLNPSSLVEDTKMTCHAAAAGALIKNRPVAHSPKTLNEWNRIQIDDVNAPKQSSKEGFYQVPLSILDSKRSSPRDFILNTANELFPNGARKYRLDIRLNTFVTKIIFDQNKRATGVEYVEGAYLYKASPNSPSAVKTGSGTLQATREIIISAGAFNTPQLLKLSGIGPKAELDNLKIPVVVDRPGVGTNLMDRYESSVISKTNSSYQILNGCSLLSTNPDACLERWKNYAPAVKGFYTGNAFPLAVIKKSSVAEKDADIFMFGGPVFFQGFYPGWADVSSLFPAGAKGWWTWVVLKAHVHNTAGTVTLRSGDPLDTPIINLNQFDTGTTTDNGDQKDLQASFEGVQFARNMTRKLNCADGPFEDVLPGPQIKIDDVAGTKNYIKNRAFGHHASCTARIGRIDDSNAVLDSNFKVIGVTGLRVVDASSFPKTPGFFPMLPLYMISEKAADVIIQERDAKP